MTYIPPFIETTLDLPGHGTRCRHGTCFTNMQRNSVRRLIVNALDPRKAIVSILQSTKEELALTTWNQKQRTARQINYM